MHVLFIIYYFFYMELQLHINGQKCEVKFEKHHNFERVLKLLKQNKVIPQKIPYDKFEIIGKDGKQYSKTNLVVQSLIPPETIKCEVQIKYSNSLISSFINSSNQNNGGSPGVKKARLVDIIKSFFQKIQKHEFKKLEKYQSHQEEIVSLVAQFAHKYQRLYALNLYYKQQTMKLNKNEEQQLDEYREKFKDMFKRTEQESSSRLMESIKFNSNQKQSKLEVETRENIEQNNSMIEWLERELQGNKLILQETINTYTREADDLRKQIACWQTKYQELQIKMSQILSENQSFSFITQQMQSQINTNKQKSQINFFQIHRLRQKYEQKELELQKMKRQFIKMSDQSKILIEEVKRQSKQHQITKCQLQQLKINYASLEQRFQVEKTQNFAQIICLKQKSQIQLKQKDILTQKLLNLQNELQKTREQMKYIENQSKLKELPLLQIRSTKSSEYLKKQDYQPINKLNECFQTDLAHQLIYQLKLYCNKTLIKLNNIIYHPSSLKIQKKRIAKNLKRKQNILIVCKTQQDRVVGGFSSLSIDSFCSPEEIKVCKSFLFNTENDKINIFKLKQGKQPVKYDEDFFILGQQELTVDYQTMTLSSRFVNKSISYQDPDQRHKYLLSPLQENNVKIKEFWIFYCTFV